MTDPNANTDFGRRMMATVFAIIAAAMLAGGYMYYRMSAARDRDADYEVAATSGSFIVAQVQHWRMDREQDATALVETPGFSAAVAALAHDPAAPARRSLVRDYLRAAAAAPGASNALVLGLDGRVLARTSESDTAISAATARAAATALAGRQPVLSDLFVGVGAHVFIDAAAAVHDPATGHPVAIAVICSDARAGLNPLLHQGPLRGGVVLVQRVGDAVASLSDLLIPTGASVADRVPLARADLPSVQAVLGATGRYEGTDYAGTAVVADLRPIPGSPWFLVVKAESSVELAAIRERAGGIILACSLLILLAAASTAYVYRRRQASAFQALYQAEHNRQAAERAFRATLYSIGDAVITADTTGRIQEMNPVAERMTGWSEADARGRPLDEVFHVINEATRAPLASPVSRTLHDGVPVVLADHTLLVARDGTERPIADSAAPIRDAASTLTGVVLVFSDRTAQRAAERARIEAEERLRMALAAANQGVFDLNVATGITTVSPEYASMLGFDPTDLHETVASWTEQVHPDDRERVTRVVNEHLAGTRPDYRVEYRIQNRAGEWRWMLSLGRVVERAADGRPVRLLGTRTDITAQKDSESRVVRLSRLYAAVNQSNQAIVRSRTEDDIFREICEAAVRSGSAQMAWVGLADADTHRVRPVAAFGNGTAYVDGIQISTNPDDPTARGPVGSCILSNRPVWSQDWQRDPTLSPWRERGASFGWHSLAALPLHRNGAVVGALALYATVPDAFDQEARALLTQMARDISFALDNLAGAREREVASEALRESEARLVRAQQIARMGFLDWDLRTNTIFWSDEVVRLFGSDPGANQQTLTSTVALAHPDDRALMQRRLDRAVRGEEPYDVEHRMIRPDGRTIWVHAQGDLSRDADGNAVRFLGTVVDITAHHQAEAELRLSESRLRAIIDAEPECVKVVDPAGVMREMNAAGLAMLEADTFADIANRPLQDLVVPAQRAAFMDLHARVMAGQSGMLEFEVIGLKGTHRWIETHAVPLRGDRGQVIALLGVTRDITERRRAQAELALQSAALNAVADAIVITDRRGAVEWVNPAFADLTGYAPGEALGHNPRELVKSGVHDAAFYAQMWATITAGDTWRGELTNRRKDGTQYAEHMTITPVRDTAGAIAHFVAVKRDVSAQRQLEAQFLQSQKMETVGRLAGGIAHDFNNLLTVINGTVELLLMDLPRDDPQAVELQAVAEAGRRAGMLTRQLLAFSRKQIMRMEVLHLNTALRGMQSMLRRVIGEDVRLDLHLADDAAPVRADAGQLDQVVLNLAVNARDAMPHGGTLTIETQNVDLDAQYAASHPSVKPGPHVMLAVSDTGTGMDAATRERIFEPFFTTKELGRGTGLGLSTVYGIVKQSGGSIWVYSEPEEGTAFKIYLPAADLDQPAPAVAPSLPHQAGSETVLVVEDEPALRHLAQRALGAVGYQVLTAATGAEAADTLAHHRGQVHLLLTDVVLPGIHGRELATQMTAAHPGLRVLFTSGYTDDTVLRLGVSAHTAHFIAKPYTVANLTRKVREVLDAPPPEAGTP